MVIPLAVAALLIASTAATSTPVTETFSTAVQAAGVAFDWVVPEGVTSLTITATGGNGGESDPARPGGGGATVTATIPVEAGQVLSITLGADGLVNTGGAGFGSGGNGIDAGGGGGSTGIAIDGTVTIVAGAGGGSSTNSSAGGGGAAGTPDGQPGSRRGGGGTGGNGGLGVAPWGEPGGASFVGGGGTVNGSEAGAGGGAGYGGGGAGGAYGDGGGGGSYSATASSLFSPRLDDLVDGWVQLDYLLPVPEEVVEAPQAAIPADTPLLFGLSSAQVGMIAGGLAVLFIGALITRAAVRRR